MKKGVYDIASGLKLMATYQYTIFTFTIFVDAASKQPNGSGPLPQTMYTPLYRTVLVHRLVVYMYACAKAKRAHPSLRRGPCCARAQL